MGVSGGRTQPTGRGMPMGAGQYWLYMAMGTGTYTGTGTGTIITRIGSSAEKYFVLKGAI